MYIHICCAPAMCSCAWVCLGSPGPFSPQREKRAGWIDR